jgi:hypothetical protein
MHPHFHLFDQKNEIEKIVQELLEVDFIHPSKSPYSSPIVMVLKKEVTWRMFPDFHSLKKITVKETFPIPVIDTFWMNSVGLNTLPNLTFVMDTTKYI